MSDAEKLEFIPDDLERIIDKYLGLSSDSPMDARGYERDSERRQFSSFVSTLARYHDEVSKGIAARSEAEVAMVRAAIDASLAGFTIDQLVELRREPEPAPAPRRPLIVQFDELHVSTKLIVALVAIVILGLIL